MLHLALIAALTTLAAEPEPTPTAPALEPAAATEAQPAPAEAALPPAAAAEPTPAPATPPAGDGVSLTSLLAEVRRIKEEIGIGPLTYESFAGMGPAASKVYYSPNGLSLGGYGEGFYAFRPAPGARSESDLLRLVLYTGFKFTDRILVNAEVEFEHGITSKKGEVAVEFLYLDFKLHDLFTVRVGNVLVPMGFINEVHEPPFFHGVQRPELERNLLPSTWNENGLGFYGEFKGLKYRAYLLTGLQALSEQKCVTDDKGTPETSDDVKLCDTGNTGFADSSWIRGGRQRGSKVITENWAGAVRVDYERKMYQLGVSGYWGRSGQGQAVNGTVVKGEVFLFEAHATFRFKGLQARGLFVYGSLSDADVISNRQKKKVGSEVMGGYGEVAYDVLALAMPDADMSLTPFFRFEGQNLHHALSPGTDVNADGTPDSADPAQQALTITAGLSFKPIGNVTLKADYQRRWTASSGAATDVVNLGMGFAF